MIGVLGDEHAVFGWVFIEKRKTLPTFMGVTKERDPMDPFFAVIATKPLNSDSL